MLGRQNETIIIEGKSEFVRSVKVFFAVGSRQKMQRRSIP